jgi:hypothetical protein
MEAIWLGRHLVTLYPKESSFLSFTEHRPSHDIMPLGLMSRSNDIKFPRLRRQKLASSNLSKDLPSLGQK